MNLPPPYSAPWPSLTEEGAAEADERTNPLNTCRPAGPQVFLSPEDARRGDRPRKA